MSFSTSSLLILVSFCFVFFSCKNGAYEETDLHGEWKVKDWEIKSTGQKRSNQMDFNFAADGRYKVDYGRIKEVGNYWIANSYLHTQEDDELEKKVKILKLNQDTFHMQMNRGGSLENVLLVKEK